MRVDAVAREESVVGARLGLGHQRAGDDVEDVLEQAAEAERLGGLLGVASATLLVKISLRPGSAATAAANAGLATTEVRSTSWTKARKASGSMASASISPFSVVP